MKNNAAANKRASRAGKTAPPARNSRRPPSARGQSDPSIDGRAALAPDDVGELLNCLAAGVFKISREGRIVYLNSQARRLVEMGQRNPLDVSLHEFEPYTIWPDGSPCGYDDYPAIKCLRTGELQSGVILGLKQPGRIVWITVTAVPLLDPRTGQPESTIVTVVDSSQPKHVEDSLRESEERYRRLVEHAPDAIIVHRKGRIRLINDAGVRLYGGRSRDDFIGRSVLDFVPDAHKERVRRRIQAALEGEVTPLEVQRHRRLDGRPVDVEVTGSSCMYQGRLSVQTICRDATARIKAERALRRAKSHLERRVRERTEELTANNFELERKQRFMEQTLAAGERDRKLVAYEIHDTILQDVIGALMFLDAIGDHADPSKNENAARLEQARKLLRNSIGEARRMISGLRPLILDEQGIVGAVDYLVSEFNGRGMAIRFTHRMRADRLASDFEVAVFRIVQEALTNLERHSQSRRGEVQISERKGRLRVEVRDFGVGFKPDAVVRGHFGLEGIHERARLAGGSASIKSSPGKGTQVVVELPIAQVKQGE